MHHISIDDCDCDGFEINSSGQHRNQLVPVWHPYAMATDSVNALIVERSSMTMASRNEYLVLYNEYMKPHDCNH